MTTKHSKIRIAKGARKRSPFASIDDAIAEIRAGRMIIVVDDEDRENEGRPDDRRREDHAGGDQLHGALRARADLPLDDRAAARRARDSACRQRQHDVLRHRVLCADRRQESRHAPESRRPTEPPPCWRRSTPPRHRLISRGRATCRRFARATAACSCAPVRPKPASILRAWPARIRPASSAKS